MKKFRLVVIFTLLTLRAIAQSQDSSIYKKCHPSGGINSLIFNYYSIDFTSEQRELIGSNEIELLYNIDAQGSIIDFDINGLVRPDIVDSFLQRTIHLPLFIPAFEDTIPVGCLYTARFTYPKYYYQLGFLQDKGKLSYGNVDSIIYRNRDIEISAGAYYHFQLGKIRKYIKNAGAINIDVTYRNKKNIYGLSTLPLFYEKKQDLPSQNYMQSKNINFLFIGGHYGYKLNPLSWVRGGVYYGICNIIDSEDIELIKNSRLDGGAIDVRYQYLIPLKKSLRKVLYGIQEDIFGVSVFGGALKYFFSPPELKGGPMLYVGANFTFLSRQIADYKLKKD